MRSGDLIFPVSLLVFGRKESSLLPSVFTPSATAAKAPSRTYTRPPSTITAPASSLARIGQQSPAATPSLTISAIDPSHYQFVDLPPPGIFQNFFGESQLPYIKFDHRSLAGFTWLRSSLSSRLRSSHLLNSITGAIISILENRFIEIRLRPSPPLTSLHFFE
ncbi:hypothetical protein HHK36_028564 [Tetracentron sinense]|uniref:Uncharacterized protein n=1 Tax=Tetracentron sinense TaxID=13715 RepID=A0A835D0P9_TETSI|nr:hypothetical protein HHK36_028564 [Tetracentron sinense]